MNAPTLLSHPMSPDTPAYGGGESLSVEALTSTARGDTANTVRLTFPNHLGTHIDLPRHFFGDGAAIEGYGPDRWVFRHPQLIDVDAGDGDLISPSHLQGALDAETDLLLLRSGHEKRRSDDAFWAAGPGLAPELAPYLREEFPAVRAVGVDLISITSRLQREAGRAAHRAFLDPDLPGEPILLIEDVAMAAAPRDLGTVLVSPFFFENADGAPVTIWSFPDSPAP